MSTDRPDRPDRPVPAGPVPLDHRELAAAMGIFATSAEVGPGLPLWLPAGSVVRQELEALAREIAHRDGCLPVHTPVMAKRSLFERSGHWAKFRDDMFPPLPMGGEDEEDLVLRPANCPHHAMVYAAQPHSYRDLPVRLHELAPMFRAERSGVLSGLSRVRQITLDDTHVFCRPDQVAAEVARALRSALRAQRVLGLPVDVVRLSRRGAAGAHLGTDGQWRDAEAALRSAALEVLAHPEDGGDDLPLVDAPGEAAFYGPKLDLQVHDGRGHEETIATVQLDFAQPERFDLTYDGSDGLPHRVVMVHRGTVGSMERVVAALLEHHQGRVPLWLAPVQVCVLPVSPAQDDDARSLQEELLGAGLRARLERSGSLGARVRASRGRRDALLAVVGAEEVAGGTVQVTDPAAGHRARVPRSVLLERVVAARSTRALRVDWPPVPTGG